MRFLFVVWGFVVVWGGFGVFFAFFVASFFLEMLAVDEDVYSSVGGKSDLHLWTDHRLGRNEVDW